MWAHNRAHIFFAVGITMIRRPGSAQTPTRAESLRAPVSALYASRRRVAECHKIVRHTGSPALSRATFFPRSPRHGP